ncbi:MAG: DNA-binding protein, partial [Microcystis aeruginosa SX13-01]|nr:DNA-binding protein [Microcystis aeruginosa SX13-01]
DLRQLGDYDQVIEITREQTKIALEYATVFVEQASHWLNTH